jgi:hypothetical protein
VSTSKKSFWSSVPGLVTGMAGVLTAAVGLITVLISLGVIGGNGGSGPSPPVGTNGSGASGSTSSGGSGAGSTSAAGGSTGVTPTTTAKASFAVDRPAVTLGTLANKAAVVTVTNQGTTALAVKAPRLDGPQKDQFTVDASDCTRRAVPSGSSCSIKVTFAGVAGASATMTVIADNAPSVDVALNGTL